MLNTLPPELLQSIFDNFAGWEGDSERSALLACTLTCRQWRESAQCALFSHLTLCRPHTFDSLFDALTASPHLAPAVKHLKIIIIPPLIWLRHVPSADSAAQIVGLLTNVSSIQLGRTARGPFNPRWTLISYRMREALQRLLASPTLTTLEIRNWNFDIPVAHYLNIILASPSLRRLSFLPSIGVGSSLEHTKEEETLCRARFEALAPTLTLWIMDRDAEVRLASSATPGYYDLFALRDLDEAFEAPFLQVLGDLLLPHVIELQVFAETGHGPPTLSTFSQLARIGIDYSRAAIIGTQTSAALALLRTHSAPALLRVLKIKFDMITLDESTPRGQERVGWLRIVEMLASKHFPNLSRLEIVWAAVPSSSSDSDSVAYCGDAELGLDRIRDAGIELHIESVLS